jgi:hypothetical protein
VLKLRAPDISAHQKTEEGGKAAAVS